MNIPELKEIELCQSQTIWDLGNKVLYDLCSDNFDHSTDEKIVAKVWLIGRAYAAAIERRKPQENDSELKGDKFYEKVVSIFKESSIDDFLNKVKGKNTISLDNINEVLEIHKYLVDEIRVITDLYKRSFCSKYLHFHLPNLFFIYDSRAYYAMNKIVSNKDILLETENEYSLKDNEYYKFFLKCIYLRDKIKEKYSIDLTPRQIDNLLLNRS